MTANKIRRSPWKWIAVGSVLLLAGAVISARFVIHRAEPIVRTRIIETLSNRFQSKVELRHISVWVNHGLEVTGEGLKIFGATDPNPYESGVQPLLRIGEFVFSRPCAASSARPCTSIPSS